jgi:microsomal dipeptidase-like Zn-dependent dipeptidase
VTIDKVFNLDLVTAFKHAVNLVIIDGLCLGIDVSGDRQKSEILRMCDKFLLNIDQQVFGVEPSRIDYDRLPHISTQTNLGV